MSRITPDDWIERNDMVDEPAPPDPDEACPVCDRMECICPIEHLERMVEHSKKTFTPQELADAIIEAKRKHPESFPR